MIAFFVLVLCVVSFLAMPTSCEYQLFLRDLGQNKTWIYVYDFANPEPFNQTISWCISLGGSLPTLHSQEDLDFLGDTVIAKDSEGGNKMTWLNMKLMPDNTCKWLDKSPYDFSPRWYRTCAGGCDNSCCGVIMWNDVDHKQISPRDCSQFSRKVCIIKISDDRVPDKVGELFNLSPSSRQETFPYRTKIIKPAGYEFFFMGFQKWAASVNRFMSKFNESAAAGLNFTSFIEDATEHHSRRIDQFANQIKHLLSLINISSDDHSHTGIWIFLLILMGTCIALTVTIVSIFRRPGKDIVGNIFFRDNENYDSLHAHQQE